MAKEAVNSKAQNKELTDKLNQLQNEANQNMSTINSLQQQLNQKNGELTIERQTTQDLSNQLGNLQREKARYFLLYNSANAQIEQLKKDKPAK